MRRALAAIGGLVIVVAAVWFLWGRFHFFTQKTTTPTAKPLPPPLTYETKPQVGNLAPNFDLQTTTGTDIRLGDFLGRVVVVDFWATWCPFCQTQLSSLARLAAEAPNDLVVIAINRGELSSTINDFVAARFIRPANMFIIMDPLDSTYKEYAGTTMPQTFFVDRDGVIRSISNRELLLGELRDAVGPLRAAPAACPGTQYGKNCR